MLTAHCCFPVINLCGILCSTYASNNLLGSSRSYSHAHCSLLLSCPHPRSSTDLLASNQSDAFAKTLWMVPIIYIILSLLRFALIALFRPLFIASKGDLSFKEAAFVAVAGLRGSVSLIMGQAVVTERALSGEIPVSMFVCRHACNRSSM